MPIFLPSVLSEGAEAVLGQIRADLIARLKLGYFFAEELNRPCYVGTEYPVSRAEQPPRDEP